MAATTEHNGEVDILHPLTTINWETCASLPKAVFNAECVVWNDRVWVGGYGCSKKLFMSSPDLHSWTELPIPAYCSSLATYCSDLVLAGGIETSSNEITDKIWSSSTGKNWQLSLPSMSTKRYFPSAINTVSPEYLVVAGGLTATGYISDDSILATVEVLHEGQWSIVQPLPFMGWGIRSALHNGKLYYLKPCSWEENESIYYYCDIDYLSSQNVKWSRMEGSSVNSYLASFGQQLISFERDSRAFAHSFLTWCWSYIGDVPCPFLDSAPVNLPTGQLLLMNKEVYKGSLTTTLYDPDSRFNLVSLLKLQEGAGLKVVTELMKNYHTLTQLTGLPQSNHELIDILGLDSALKLWDADESSRCPPTWKSLYHILNQMQLEDLSRQIEGYLLGKTSTNLKLYHQVLSTREYIEMWFIKVILLGAPRLGKTTVRRRLTGEINDISSSGGAEQPSTGAVESAPSIVVRELFSSTTVVTSTCWEAMKDLSEELQAVLQLGQQDMKSSKSLYKKRVNAPNSNCKPRDQKSPDMELSVKYDVEQSDKPDVEPSDKSQSRVAQHSAANEVNSCFGSVCTTNAKPVKSLFQDTTFIKMEDTGGQPEFMDMLPALTVGPALYLLFCKLIDELKSPYTVCYLSPSGESTAPFQSIYTVEEVLLSSLASISCLESHSYAPTMGTESAPPFLKELLPCKKSIAYIIGTYKDSVSEKQIDEFDKELQQSIRPTDFFNNDLIKFSSESRMIHPIDNMSGGSDEIQKIRKFLEEEMKQHFTKLRIPTAWLILGLCLRKKEEKIATLSDVLQQAEKFGMSKEETVAALWFLHQHAGFLMYFPELEEMKDTIICDTQIVYDSATNLIVNTFKFGRMGVAAIEKFRETGRFSLEDISKATDSASGKYIPLNKLVKLLEHLNIIAQVHSDSPNGITYFMPCILPNATQEEIDCWWASVSDDPLSPAPLFIRYRCGYVPIGVFPAMIAFFTGQPPFKIIDAGIRKNRVCFRFGSNYHTITLVSHPKYYAVHISPNKDADSPIYQVCSRVHGLVKHTLKEVTSRMNYSFNIDYQLAFECPIHPGRDHLCVVERDDGCPHFMCCLRNMKDQEPVRMKKQHLVWFKEEVLSNAAEIKNTAFRSSFVSSLPASARPLLELELDWDNNGVDKDLSEIANYMIKWEETLSTHLELTPTDISDIKDVYRNSPPLQRREALKKWKSKQGFRATYGTLLDVFVKAGYTQCAKALCNVLRSKCELFDAKYGTCCHDWIRGLHELHKHCD